MKFLQNWHIKTDLVPAYPDFNQDFAVPIDFTLAKMMLECDLSSECLAEWKKLVERIDPKTNEFRVKYAPRYGLGRRYADCPKETSQDFKTHYSSLVKMNRLLKNTIFAYQGWVDYDQVKGHVTILFELARRNGKQLPAYGEFLSDFDKIAKDLIAFYSADVPLTKRDIKWLFNKTIYGGGIAEWLKAIQAGDPLNNDPPKTLRTTETHPFYQKFFLETQSLISIVYESNDELQAKVSGDEQDLWRRKNRVMSYFCGIIENELTFQAYKFAYKNKMCQQRRVDWGYDGFTIPPGSEEVDIDKMNEYVRSKTGFKTVTFIRKEYDDVLTDVLEKRRLMADPCEVSSTDLQKDMTEMEMASSVMLSHPHWKFCGNRLYAFDNETGMWTDNSTVHFKLVTDSLKSKVVSKIITCNRVKSVVVHISSMCIDNEWLDEKSESSLGKLLFTNGYYDSSTNTFHTEFNPAIVFMMRINHQYINQSQDYINDIKRRFFYNPLTEEVGDYYMELLARGLMGDKMKKIAFCLGKSDTGKSTITKAFQASVGLYCGTFNAECFTLKATSQDEAQILRWAFLARYKRLMFSNEMNLLAKLNGNMIKKIASGGDTLVGRTHGGNETNFIPHYFCSAFANDISEISPYDDAVRNRLCIISYDKVFVDDPTEPHHLQKDPNIEHEISTDEFQMCFIQLMIQSYVNFKKNGEMPKPEKVMYAMKEWIAQDADVMNTFLNDFEFGDGFLPSNEIKEWLKENNLMMSEVKIAREIKQYAERKGFEIENKYKKIDGKSVKCWFGIKRLE